MIYFLFGLIILVAFMWFGRWLSNIPAAQIAKHARFGGVALLVGLAGLLLLTGRVQAMSQVLALVGAAMRNRGLFTPRPKGFDDVDRSGGPSAGPDPSVRTSYLEMQLNQATGDLNGQFIAGPWAGKKLNQLGQGQLLEALQGVSDDPESTRLLEAYLDRTFSSWRENHDQRASGRSTSTTNAGSMGEDEAYEILGLEPGANAEAIRAAHRRLMGNIHPDRGGSTYLAAKVNLAKEVLLKLHGQYS